MEKIMKVTGTIGAYISPHCSLAPADLEKPESFPRLSFIDSGTAKYYLSQGYTHVGTAAISVELLDRDALVASKIAALREESAAIRAEATAKVTRIEGQIQQLLCIENSAAPA
jgi:hypothetical protein